MKTIANFLMKVLVKQFYSINAGFFLFGFFFFFGIVKGELLIPYHKSLLLSIISAPLFTGIVCLAWLLYNIKCIQFCSKTINATDSSYIFILKALPPLKQWMIYLLISLFQYLPVFIYSWLVVYTAFNQSMFITGALVAFYQLAMIVLSAFILFRNINQNNLIHPLDRLLSKFVSLFKIRIGYYAFLLGHLFYEKKMTFVIVKVFSLLLLSVSFVRNGDDFDNDLFNIFFQVILTAHALLVFYFVGFSESQLQFSRNLPLPLYKAAGMYLFTFSILLLPEAAFMLVNNHGNLTVSNILLQYLIAAATLFLYTAILYGCGLDMESYMLFVFIAFLMIFFLEKSGQQLLSLLAILFIAAIVFKGHYYSFEQEVKK
jgi:hypothetical protein